MSLLRLSNNFGGIAGKGQHHDGQGYQCCSFSSGILARGLYFPIFTLIK